MGKGKIIEKGKKQVRETLALIQQRCDEIRTSLEILWAKIDSIDQQAKETASAILCEKSKDKFLHLFSKSMTQLQQYQTDLFLIRSSLPDDKGGILDSSSSEIESDGDEAEVGRAPVEARLLSASPAGACAQIKQEPRGKANQPDKERRTPSAAREHSQEKEVPHMKQGTSPIKVLPSHQSESVSNELETMPKQHAAGCKPKCKEEQRGCGSHQQGMPPRGQHKSRKPVGKNAAQRQPGCASAPEEPAGGQHEDYGLGPEVPPMEFNKGHELDVAVMQIDSPWMLWLQPISPTLDDLIDEMSVYHDRVEKSDWGYALRCPPRVSMLVCARFASNNQWYRARITALYSCTGECSQEPATVSAVQVFYIDFGNSEECALEALRPLPEQFARLPAHAIPCALAEVGPAGSTEQWEKMQIFQCIMLMRPSSGFCHAVLNSHPAAQIWLGDIYIAEKDNLFQKITMGPFTRLMQHINEKLVTMNVAVKLSNEQIASHIVRLCNTSVQPGSAYTVVESMKHLQYIKLQVPKRLWCEVRTNDAMEEQGPSQDLGVDDISEGNACGYASGYSKTGKKRCPKREPHRNPSTDSEESNVRNQYRPQRHTKERNPQKVNFPGKQKREHQKTSQVPQAQAGPQGEPKELCPSFEDSHQRTQFDSEVTEGTHWDRTEKTSTRPHCKTPKRSCTGEKRQRSCSGPTTNREPSPQSDLNTPTNLKDSDFCSSKPHSEGKETKSCVSNREGYRSDAGELRSPTVSSDNRKRRKEPCNEPTPNSDVSDDGACSDKPLKVLQEVLRELGLPTKLPEGCKYHASFEKWMVAADGKKASSPVETHVDESPPLSGRSLPEAETKSLVREAVKDTSIKDCEQTNTSDVKPMDLDSVCSTSSVKTCTKEQYPLLTLTIPNDGCVEFMMSHIVSPSCFYIHILSEKAGHVDQIKYILNEIYGNKDQLTRLYNSPLDPKPQDMCVARYSEDGKFYRGEIRSIEYDRVEGTEVCQQVEVLYVDFGNCEWHPWKNIYSMDPSLAEFPCQAVPCCLTHIKPSATKDKPSDAEPTPSCDRQPINTDEAPAPKEADRMKPTQTSDVWSLPAIEKFEEMCGYIKKLFGYVDEGERGCQKFSCASGEHLGLYIMDTSHEYDMSINEELVRLGFAQLTDSMIQIQNFKTANMVEVAKVSEEFKAFDPMVEDYLSPRNAYGIDIDDPGVAIEGYKSEGNRGVCRFFSRGMNCWRGKRCPFDHVDPSVLMTQKVETICVSDPDMLIEPPEESTWVALEVTAVINPSHFYVVFPFGTHPIQDLMEMRAEHDITLAEDFQKLQESMTNYYEEHPFQHRDLTLFALGEVTAAKFSLDDMWYRAKVIDNDPEVHRVRVFYVDFGNTEWVRDVRVRQLDYRFMHLPFQAVECFLNVNPTRVGGWWTSKAKEDFLEMTDDRVLFAYIIERNINGSVRVDLHDTQQGEVNISHVLCEKGHATKAPVPPPRDHYASPLATAGSDPTVRYLPG